MQIVFCHVALVIEGDWDLMPHWLTMPPLLTKKFLLFFTTNILMMQVFLFLHLKTSQDIWAILLFQIMSQESCSFRKKLQFVSLDTI